MSARPSLRGVTFVCAIALGLLADQLVRVDGRPGLGFALWAIAGVAILMLLPRFRETPVSAETRWLTGGALFFAALLPLRDSGALAAFALFSAIVLVGLAAGRGAVEWARSAYLVEVGTAAIRVALLIALGPLGWSLGAARAPAEPASGGGRSWPRYARTFARGALMAAPVLLVLAALLSNADPMFERLLHSVLFAGIQPLLDHLAFAALIAWLTSGYLRAFLVTDDGVMDRVRLPRPALAPQELAVALSLVDLLFLIFMAVQVRYLFGGAGLVEVTKGLSYAEYARRGFFELVVAAVLVVPVLLIADWAARDATVPESTAGELRRDGSEVREQSSGTSVNGTRGRGALRGASLLLVLLLAGVLASAAFRMRLYQDAYGLTEQRLNGSAFMAWLTFVLGWLAVTVLRGHRRRFASGAIAAGLATVLVLHVINPHAIIARVNIARASSGARYDGNYLTRLSADAVPELIAGMPALPEPERCRVATMLARRWKGDRPGGWRTWNLSDARARTLVAQLPPVAPCN